jgi:hypothetical protein
MATLDLYKNRQFNSVKLTDKTTQKEIEYKLPNEYTVEEIERLLELQVQRESMEKQDVKDRGEEQLQEFWRVVFDQLEILFQHYQPEITSATLRSLLTHKEALEIVGFYNTNRFQKNSEKPSGKKKAHEMN